MGNNILNVDYGLKTTDKKRDLMEMILELSRVLVVFLSVYSAFRCFISGMGVEILTLTWASFTAFVVLFFYLLHQWQASFSRSLWISIPLCVISYVGLVYYNFENIMQGAYYVSKRFVEMVNFYFKMTATEPNPMIPSDGLIFPPEYYQTVFICAMTVVIVAIVGMAYYNRLHIFFYLVYTVPFLIIPIVLGSLPDKGAFILYASVVIITMGSGGMLKRVKNAGVQGRTAAIMAFFCILCVGMVHIVFPEDVYEEKVDLEKMKRDVQRKASEISRSSFLSDMTIGEWLNYNFSGGIGYGTLGDRDEVKYGNIRTLKLELDNHIFDMQNSLYLKGFVGDAYDGIKWKSLHSADVPNYMDDVASLIEKGKYREGVAQDCFLTLPEDKVVTMNIKNMGAGKGRMFVPYYLNTSYSIDEGGIIRPDEKGGNHVVDYYTEMLPSLQKFVENNIVYNLSSFLLGIEAIKSQNEKNEFIKKYYLTVPEGIQALQYVNIMDMIRNYLEEYVGERIEDKDNAMYKKVRSEVVNDIVAELYSDIDREDWYEGDYYSSKFDEEDWTEENKKWLQSCATSQLNQVVEMIQQHLWKNTRYSLAPGRTPADKEFVDYFLYENRIGYCVHYATTATLMFRAMGIPARIAEGYMVSRSNLVKASAEANAKKPEDSFTVYVKDSDAHSWVEIYVDNVGWIPIEVTPGSAGDSEILEELTTIPADNRRLPAATPYNPYNSSKTGPTILIQNDQGNFLSSATLAFILLFGAVFNMALIVFGVRRQFHSLYRQILLPRKSAEMRIGFLYQRLASVFRLYGVHYKGQSVDEYSEQLEHTFAFMDLTDIKANLLENVYKNAYARDTVSEEECCAMQEFYERFRQRILQQERRLKRWYLKNILCI